MAAMMKAPTSSVLSPKTLSVYATLLQHITSICIRQSTLAANDGQTNMRLALSAVPAFLCYLLAADCSWAVPP